MLKQWYGTVSALKRVIFNLGLDSLHKARVKIGSLSLNGFDGGGHSPCKSFKWPSSFILEEEERKERERERRGTNHPDRLGEWTSLFDVPF